MKGIANCQLPIFTLGIEQIGNWQLEIIWKH